MITDIFYIVKSLRLRFASYLKNLHLSWSACLQLVQREIKQKLHGWWTRMLTYSLEFLGAPNILNNEKLVGKMMKFQYFRIKRVPLCETEIVHFHKFDDWQPFVIIKNYLSASVWITPVQRGKFYFAIIRILYKNEESL